MNGMERRTDQNPTDESTPSRDAIIQMVAKEIYGGKVLNNSHRGDVVEMMVLKALGPEWRHVGLGWHPWDLQRGNGPERVRIQVRQTAALQLWGESKTRSLQFNWKANAPAYFERDNPDEAIESEGWFCDLFVFGVHDVADLEICDQGDPAQWEFIVIPVCDLAPRLRGVTLTKAKTKWRGVNWSELKPEVDRVMKAAANQRLKKQGEIRKLRGKLRWEGDLEAMRID